MRHPKDKALVENAVKLLYRSIYLDMEGMTFSGLEELNTAVRVSLLDFNEKVMAGREVSRKEMFLQGEKDYLRPLPVKRYVMKERKLMTVGKNSYVSLFKHHYSVPKEYVGRRMTILYDADTVEIYCGMNLVATHDRCDIPYAYSWKKEHNLPGHYGPYDKDLEELFQRASNRQYRIELSPGSGACHAISAQSVQVMPGYLDVGEKIRSRPSGCGLRMCGPEVAIRVSGLARGA